MDVRNEMVYSAMRRQPSYNINWTCRIDALINALTRAIKIINRAINAIKKINRSTALVIIITIILIN